MVTPYLSVRLEAFSSLFGGRVMKFVTESVVAFDEAGSDKKVLLIMLKNRKLRIMSMMSMVH